jgi:hypothetical protein
MYARPVSATLGKRIVRAARLEPALYEEVERDENALGQAAAVVVLSSPAAGVGTVGLRVPGGFVVGTVAALVGWIVWAYTTTWSAPGSSPSRGRRPTSASSSGRPAARALPA